MDIPALVLAIVLATLHAQREKGEGGNFGVWQIILDRLRRSALSALILGMLVGLFAYPEQVHAQFYDSLFRGFLTILMLVMGIEA